MWTHDCAGRRPIRKLLDTQNILDLRDDYWILECESWQSAKQQRYLPDRNAGVQWCWFDGRLSQDLTELSPIQGCQTCVLRLGFFAFLLSPARSRAFVASNASSWQDHYTKALIRDHPVFYILLKHHELVHLI
jgi:hypothetical protein